jgi:hypothetical protein
VRKTSLRRLAVARWYFFVLLVVLFAPSAVGGAPGTLASFTAETANQTSPLAAGWIGAATSLTVTPSGYDAQLAWTPGTHGPVAGQQLYVYDNGSSAGCPSSGYSPVTTASAGTSSLTAFNPAATTLSAAVGTTTLNVGPAGLNNSTTTINAVSSSASFSSVPFVIEIDSEQLDVTAESGAGSTVWTVVRGYNGSTAAAHANGAEVDQVSVSVGSDSGFPPSGSYAIAVDSENMTVTSGQGTTSWIVARGANSTTVAGHTSGALVTSVPDPVDGHYYCYEVVSTSGSSWTATASFPATQMGLVLTGVAITGNAANNVVGSSDTIVATFNQQPGIAAGLNGTGKAYICQVWDGSTPSNVTLYLNNQQYGGKGNPTCTTSGASAYDIALTGMQKAHAAASTQTVNATVTVSISAPWTVTWTLTGTGQTLNSQSAVTATPSSSVMSQATTDHAPACTSATYNCTPAATGTGF